jgi:hypothetical protein
VHHSKNAVTRKVSSTNSRGRPSRQKQVSKENGFFGTFVLEDVQLLNTINRYVEDLKEGKQPDVLARGSRAFFEVGDGSALKPSLAAVVDLARQKIGFPLKETTIYGDAAGVSIAPPDSCRSNSWTSGNTHRDFLDVEQPGVYSFLLCLDEMTADNGCILFWPGSKKCESVPKNRSRGVQRLKLKSEVLLGKKGTVFVFDARLLHKPLPNKTQKARTLLGWQVSKSTVFLESQNKEEK